VPHDNGLCWEDDPGGRIIVGFADAVQLTLTLS
jgi:hypothetical protein